MANRVVIQEGYSLPFEAYRRRKRRKSHSRRRTGGAKRQQAKMKACAKSWKRSGTGKYTSFMKRCLKR